MICTGLSWEILNNAVKNSMFWLTNTRPLILAQLQP